MQKKLTEPELILFNDTEFDDPGVVERPSYLRRSPIIVTLTYPNLSPVDVQKMLESGMNVVRLKSPKMTIRDKIGLIGKLDKAAAFLAQKYGMSEWPCATCVGLKTCIIRTGILEEEDEYITIRDNTEVVVTNDIAYYDKCNEENIFVDNPYLTHEFKVDMEISITEDEIIMKCIKIVSEKSIKCTVIKGGRLQSMALVCLRGGNRTHLNLTKRDLQLVKFAMEYQVDMIFVNYVRHPDTVKKVKQYIGRRWRRPIIIGGICTQEGLNHIDDIIKECDGILFSREFLAYELEAPLMCRMARIQKWVTGKCLEAGKPIYISGGIFHDGLVDGIISGKDVSDVAHSILDGASGFVLNECENIDNTLLVLKHLNELCASMEPFSSNKKDFRRFLSEMNLPLNAAEAAATSCALVANQNNCRVIVIPTVTGRTARILLWLRPSCLVLAVTTRSKSSRSLRACRSVIPLLYKGSPKKSWFETVQSRVHFAIEYAVKRGWIMYKDTYVTLEKGTEESSYCDTVRVWHVTISQKHVIECDIPESDNTAGP